MDVRVDIGVLGDGKVQLTDEQVQALRAQFDQYGMGWPLRCPRDGVACELG